MVESPPSSVATLPPGAWPRAHHAVRRLASPIQRFLEIEAGSGVLLLVATLVALLWANTGWSGAYHAIWHADVGFHAGGWALSRPVHFWVNDGLMTVFFFVVGLEIRREMYEGELSELRRATLPLAAAVGGMLVPAGIYAALNAGRAGAAGWGIPMATDIAFAVGVLAILGRRVPAALRVLLLALAVIDDIGAILVIAIFYSGGVSLAWLAIGAGCCIAVVAMRGLGLRAPVLYLVPGIALWWSLYQAGIHPTLAGVALGMLTPVVAWRGADGAADDARATAAALREAVDDHEVATHLDDLDRASREGISPSAHLQHVLHPWVAYAIMPLFALANAGVALGGAELTGDAWYVFAGIAAGLVVGKPVGIFLVARLAVATRVALRPRDVSATGLGVVGIVGGIGFTMSLFIAQLALPPGVLLETAKLAILVASGTAMVIGGIAGRLTLRAAPKQTITEVEAERSTHL